MNIDRKEEYETNFLKGADFKVRLDMRQQELNYQEKSRIHKRIH